MKIILGALGKASDPFGYVPPEIVNVPDRPTNDRSGAFKLAPAESFLPSTEPPARFAASDNFAGLGDAPPSGNYSSIKLAPLPADGFFGTAPVSGQAIKLAPEQRSGDMFEAFGPTPAPTPAPAATPADDEFVKADFEKFAEGGEIIERETLYSTSSGWKVQKRVVLKSGRERTVITCPGHLVVI